MLSIMRKRRASPRSGCIQFSLGLVGMVVGGHALEALEELTIMQHRKKKQERYTMGSGGASTDL